jgi:hypothetical protein
VPGAHRHGALSTESICRISLLALVRVVRLVRRATVTRRDETTRNARGCSVAFELQLLLPRTSR